MRDGIALILDEPGVQGVVRPSGREYRGWRGRALAVLMALFLLPAPAMAHLMPFEQGTVNIVGNAVYVVMAVPAVAFEGVDDDGDGQISPAEIGRHNAELSAQASDRLTMTDQGRPGQVGLISVISPQTGDEAGAATSYVLILQETTFPAPPTRLAIKADFFRAPHDAGQITVRAKRGDEREMVVLSARQQSHTFFRGPGSVFLDFVQTGLVHILSGYDHLLFLLTMVAAQGSARRWFGSITAFTVAHSVTLLLGSMGIVSIPSSVVEPLIALSIAAMAAANLFSRGPGKPEFRLGLVFACGLLHGLGFSSTLHDFGLGIWRTIASLAGFNLGIEIGQALVLGALALVLYGSRRWRVRLGDAPRLGLRLFSATALVGGLVLFVVRIL